MRFLKSIVFLSLSFSSALNVTAQGSLLQGKHVPQYADIYVIAGQSNAGGFPQYGNPAVSGLLQLPYAYQGFQKKFFIADAGNLHFSNQRIITDGYRWGVEQQMVHQIIKRTNRTVYLLKNWRGGIPIAEWDTAASGRLYFLWEELVSLVNNAIADVTAKGLIPRFKAVIWIQGENEALSWVNYGSDTTDTKNYYITQLGNLISKVRARWPELASTPWILQRVSCASLFYYTPSPDFPYNYNARNTVNPAMIYLSQHVSNVYTFSPDDIGTPNPSLRYNTADGSEGSTMIMPDFQHYDQLSLLAIGGYIYSLLLSKGIVQ